jgi:hypothetical protein
VAEKADGGDDGVVYLGRSSFKMKVGVGITPPLGMAAAARMAVTSPPGATPSPASAVTRTPPSPVTRTPSPVVTWTPSPVVARTPSPVLTRTRAPGVTPTPPPVLNAPRPRRASDPRAPLAFEEEGGRIGTRTKFALAGLVLTAFSCGMMFMVAVDRFWPRARPQCDVALVESASTAYPAPAAVEVAREPAVLPPPAVEPMPAARPLPAVKLATAPAPRAARAPVAAPRVPAVAPVAAPRVPVAVSVAAPSVLAAASAPVAHGRATAMARKRPAAGAPAASAKDAVAPTESWTDPFAR